jgi:hypothetical protein
MAASLEADPSSFSYSSSRVKTLANEGGALEVAVAKERRAEVELLAPLLAILEILEVIILSIFIYIMVRY